jgi:hypothetical protein
LHLGEDRLRLGFLPAHVGIGVSAAAGEEEPGQRGDDDKRTSPGHDARS